MTRWICHECGEHFPKPKVYVERGECFGRPYEVRITECPHCDSEDIEEEWDDFFC